MLPGVSVCVAEGEVGGNAAHSICRPASFCEKDGKMSLTEVLKPNISPLGLHCTTSCIKTFEF